MIQYFINDDEFEFNVFEMNGVPQSTYLYSELITDMCKNASKDETTSKKDNNDSKVNPEQYYKEITIDDFFSIFDSNFKSVV